MAYDEDMANRIREVMGEVDGVTEQPMFGGLAFLVAGHMTVAASGRGGLLVRVDPATGDKLVASTAAEPMVMRGRPMRGWLRVDADDIRTKRQLVKWITLARRHVETLPAKEAKRRTRKAR